MKEKSRKKTRKFLYVILAAFLLVGCGKSGDQDEAGLIKEVDDLPDATITIPSTLVGEEADLLLPDSQDAMVTYRIDGDTRTQLVNEIARELEESIASVLSDKYYYPDITDIQVNDSASEFTIFLNTDKPNLYESTLMLSFYTIGNKYQIYMGVPADEAVTTVIYINSETGEELARTDSTSME